MTTDALAALIVTAAFAGLVALTLVTLYATRGRRARSNAALGEALHGRGEDWPFWPQLIAEGTDSPEDKDPSEVDDEPDEDEPAEEAPASLLGAVEPELVERVDAIQVEGFRMMLPSGAHCNACHALVRAEEAYVGLSWPDYEYVWNTQALEAILSFHREVTCSSAPPPVMAGVS